MSFLDRFFEALRDVNNPLSINAAHPSLMAHNAIGTNQQGE